ncbi:DNA methyltransferase [Gordonia phage Yakult]|nr:DNA methyltransferase [Gordonia phage Yakult]
MGNKYLLDLFCGVGGAARGYQQAGFYVVGIDIEPQPDYCGEEFIQTDALDFLRTDGHEFHAIHASPPCQASSAMTKGTNGQRGYDHPQLIPDTRDQLSVFDVPTVIENVQGADLRRDLVLCGEMFGLGVIRHRLFEVSVDVVQPAHKPHRGKVANWRHGVYYPGPYFAVYGNGGQRGTIPQWQEAMGIDWTTRRKSIAEAIPPAYTQYIGEQIMELM